MVLSPLSYAPGAHPVQFVRVVELFGKGAEELLVAFLENGVVRIGGPNLGRTSGGFETFGALGAHVGRAGVLVEVAAVGPELENELQTALAGSFAEHPEAPGRLCLAGFVPEVKAFFRLGL